MKRIAFFGTKKYDQQVFDTVNALLNGQGNPLYGFDIKYYKAHPNMDNVLLVQGAEVVCCFVNDTLTADVLAEMGRLGVRLIALRCAGFNNVDLTAAAQAGIRVVRVPAYLSLPSTATSRGLPHAHAMATSPCRVSWALTSMARPLALSEQAK